MLCSAKMMHVNVSSIRSDWRSPFGMTTFLSPLLSLSFSALHVFSLMRQLPLWALVCVSVWSLLIDAWRWSEMWEEDVNQTELLTFVGGAQFLRDRILLRQITGIIKSTVSRVRICMYECALKMATFLLPFLTNTYFLLNVRRYTAAAGS